MKKKTIAGIMVTLTLLAALVYVIPIQAQRPTIKIGIIGPNELPHWSPVGMKEGAEMARDEINVAGVNVEGDQVYDFELVFADEHSAPPHDAAAAQQEIVDLVGAGCKAIMGGFRTEVTLPMLEKAMDLDTPFLINGAATSWLLANVTTNYARYKYAFRVNPINDSMLIPSVCAYLRDYLIPERLLPMCGHDLGMGYDQVKYAVLTEDLDWTLAIHAALTTPPTSVYLLGPYANLSYQARVPYTTSDFTDPYFNTIKANNIHLVLHIFSGAEGTTFTIDFVDDAVPAIAVGINVMAQLQTHWGATGGKAEIEAILNSVGTRTVIIPGVSDVFWDNFTANYSGGGWPIYTAIGAYGGLYALKEAIEYSDAFDASSIVTGLEEIPPRMTPTGMSSFTSAHDLLCTSTGAYQGDDTNVRALMVQWQASGTYGEQRVVSPVDKPYSRRFKIPTDLYEFADTDLNFDGKVNILDAIRLAGAFGTQPGDTNWNLEADVKINGKINILDAIALAGDFGGKAAVWPIP
ncbi:MAG: ABC transporter substrate-binding protein [Candidatus Bathyarchaeota archaeon]|nr:ABC transporter substrate-binding protein [Candidatus Bathyarchaeota archaeon]